MIETVRRMFPRPVPDVRSHTNQRSDPLTKVVPGICEQVLKRLPTAAFQSHGIA